MYLYRAVESQGNAIDFSLHKYRAKVPAEAFFRKSIKHDDQPAMVMINKCGSNTSVLDNFNSSLEVDNKITTIKRSALITLLT